jgi:DNA polymerase IIIc chi subunit
MLIRSNPFRRAETRAPARLRKGVPPDEQRARARETWRKLREQQSSTSDLEEIRRRARENWRAKYGPGKKS